MTKITRLELLRRLHDQTRASGAAGLPDEVLARLDSLPWDETQRWIDRLNQAIPVTDAQLGFLFKLHGGLEKIPSELEIELRSLSKISAHNRIQEMRPEAGHTLQNGVRRKDTPSPAPVARVVPKKTLWELDRYDLLHVFKMAYEEVEKSDRLLMSAQIPDGHRQRLIQEWEAYKEARRPKSLEELEAQIDTDAFLEGITL